LCVCGASAFVSMQSFGPVEGARPGVVRTAGTDRILLRHYRVFPREPSIDVDDAGLRVWLPRIFGRKPWLVPTSVVGVVDPSAWDEDADLEPDENADLEPDDGWDDKDEVDPLADPFGPEWMTAHRFVVPFLATTSMWAAPNLALLFTVPQRDPPLRWLVAGQLGLSVRASRREPGIRMDGVELRAVDPIAAVQTCSRTGSTGSPTRTSSSSSTGRSSPTGSRSRMRLPCSSGRAGGRCLSRLSPSSRCRPG
ncbi:MAG: hypothetical protein ACOYBU_08335, partial [Dermatophilaceae bacterium]